MGRVEVVARIWLYAAREIVGILWMFVPTQNGRVRNVLEKGDATYEYSVGLGLLSVLAFGRPMEGEPESLGVSEPVRAGHCRWGGPCRRAVA